MSHELTRDEAERAGYDLDHANVVVSDVDGGHVVDVWDQLPDADDFPALPLNDDGDRVEGW